MAVDSTLLRRGLRVLLLAVAAYYAVWGGEYSAFDLLRLEREGGSERVRLERLRSEVDSLRVLAGRLENDLPTLERLARERFGMIRPGEILYRFVEIDPPAATEVESSFTP